MPANKKLRKQKNEFRKDLVSGDWILIAPGRRLRPHDHENGNGKFFAKEDLATCPFEDPQKNGNNPPPVLWYPKPGIPLSKKKEFSSWFIQVIPNKYPILSAPFRPACPKVKTFGPQQALEGVGFHEVIIIRDHFKTIDKMSIEEVELLIKVYQTRYQALALEPCVNYIFIYHNQGKLAGATLAHPHSQIVAVPMVDPDIARSLAGSRAYYQKYRKCIHCAMLGWELKRKKRIVYKNKYFVTVVPFAPRVSYETRIYPLHHSSHFEKISDEERKCFAESLRDALKRIAKCLKGADYNFFIHTAPLDLKNNIHYHWHLEILPHVSIWAGVELGAGIEVVVVPPEEAAEALRKGKRQL